MLATIPIESLPRRALEQFSCQTEIYFRNIALQRTTRQEQEPVHLIGAVAHGQCRIGVRFDEQKDGGSGGCTSGLFAVATQRSHRRQRIKFGVVTAQRIPPRRAFSSAVFAETLSPSARYRI
jgi:hypothetical protein